MVAMLPRSLAAESNALPRLSCMHGYGYGTYVWHMGARAGIHLAFKMCVATNLQIILLDFVQVQVAQSEQLQEAEQQQAAFVLHSWYWCLCAGQRLFHGPGQLPSCWIQWALVGPGSSLGHWLEGDTSYLPFYVTCQETSSGLLFASSAISRSATPPFLITWSRMHELKNYTMQLQLRSTAEEVSPSNQHSKPSH